MLLRFIMLLIQCLIVLKRLPKNVQKMQWSSLPAVIEGTILHLVKKYIHVIDIFCCILFQYNFSIMSSCSSRFSASFTPDRSYVNTHIFTIFVQKKIQNKSKIFRQKTYHSKHFHTKKKKDYSICTKFLYVPFNFFILNLFDLRLPVFVPLLSSSSNFCSQPKFLIVSFV